MQKFPWQAFAQNSAYANQVALRNSQGDPFTWAELAEKINQVEVFLLQQGVTAQSAVAFCGKNSEQILFLYLAVIQLGAKILGINPAAIRIAAAIPSTLRLITFVVDTIPTFWL